MRRYFTATLGLAILLIATGCGYHQAGKASRLPTSVNTIAIPTFVNQTQTYRIETILTNAVVREFNTRTNYRVVSNAYDADAILSAQVVSAQTAPVTYDSENGRASSAIVTVHVKVNLTGKDGRVLFSDQNYTFREQYQISRELSSFFAEESPALNRLSNDFARSLVSNVLEAY